MRNNYLNNISNLEVIFNFIMSRIRKTPFKLNFALTDRCNSRCVTCSVWKKDGIKEALPAKELSLSEINCFFKKLPSHLTWLSLTGGEPFLREDLVEIIHSAIKNIQSLKIISIPTNGLSSEQILKSVKEILKIKHPYIYLSFSLDGPPDIHDKIRGVENAYKRTWDIYIQVKELAKNDDKFSISIETTISKENINYLPDFLKELKRESHKIFATIAHKAYLYENENENNEDFLLGGNINRIKEILRILKHDIMWFNSEDILKKFYLNGIPRYLKDTKNHVVPCVALKSSFTLNCFGEVLPCLMWGKALGNIRDYDYDISRILALKEAKQALEMIKNKQCPNCWTPCEAFQAIIQNLLV